MSEKFLVGDPVKAKNAMKPFFEEGEVGTVVAISPDGAILDVTFKDQDKTWKAHWADLLKIETSSNVVWDAYLS